MPEYRYAGYPSAKLFDSEERPIDELLWGDWIELTGAPAAEGMVAVHVRYQDGFMKQDELQEKRLLELVFVDVGQGDGCLMVTPDDRKLVIDAGVANNMYRFLDWRFNFRGGMRELDAVIITHPDADHYKGFSSLFADPNVHVSRVYHNGIMEQAGDPFGPEEVRNNQAYITELIQTTTDLQDFLAEPDRYGEKLYANLLKDILERPNGGRAPDSVSMLSASPNSGEQVYVPGFGKDDEVSLKVLGPVPELDEDGKPNLRWFPSKIGSTSSSESKTKNGHSVVLLLQYGKLKVLLGGDLNSPSEAYLLSSYTDLPWHNDDSFKETELIEAARPVFGADIIKSCHHGSADVTNTFLRTVHPLATIVSSGDEESHAHPRSDTLGAIGLHGRGWRPLIFSTELARSTRESDLKDAEELGRIVARLELATEPDEVKELRKQQGDLIKQLGKRNVTVYGAINLRTDGEKVVLAYRLERVRRSGNSVTRWDIYQLESSRTGEFEYVRSE